MRVALDLRGNNLIDCNSWLSKVPTTISSMNRGLGTLQYQSLSVNVQNPLNDIMGGTQDNGTHGLNGRQRELVRYHLRRRRAVWHQCRQSQRPDAHVLQPSRRVADRRKLPVQQQPLPRRFPGSETGWNWIGDPGSLSGENMSFYIPLIADPKVSGTWFFGAQHVWRTQDNGGDQTFLETNCSEFVNGLQFTGACGDWVTIGADLTSTSFGN